MGGGRDASRKQWALYHRVKVARCVEFNGSSVCIFINCGLAATAWGVVIFKRDCIHFRLNVVKRVPAT